MRRWSILPFAVILASCASRSNGPGPRSSQAELKTFHVSGDVTVEEFASEPNVMSPVEMVFDENGKIYVAEMLDYPADPTPGKPARSRIRLLEVDAGARRCAGSVRASGLKKNRFDIR